MLECHRSGAVVVQRDSGILPHDRRITAMPVPTVRGLSKPDVAIYALNASVAGLRDFVDPGIHSILELRITERDQTSEKSRFRRGFAQNEWKRIVLW